MIYRLEKEVPGKKFYPVTSKTLCPNMKKTTLEKVLWSLEELQTEIVLDKTLIELARKPLDRMLALSN